MNKIHKKSIAVLLSALLTVQVFVLPATAHAQLPVIDAANLAANTVTAGNESSQTLIEKVLNGIAWLVAKTAVQSITRSTVNWINSGFNGSPAFVTDLQQNLNVLSDTVANNFFQQLNNTAVAATGFNLTSPFQDQITQQLRANYYKQTGSLLGGAQYNLSNQSSNPKDFLNGNFSQGGFNAFFSANANPANNPFGAYQLASNALWSQIDAAAQQRKLEYQVGNGFLSWRGNCSTADSVLGASDPISSSISVDTTDNPIANIALGGDGTSNSVNLSQTEPCFGSPIKTPGSVIESQLEQQLGSGVEQLNLADSINEVVSALMSQLVGQVIGGTGLSGVSQPSSGGGSSYVDQTSTEYGTQASSLATGVTQTIANDLKTLTTYRNNWQTIQSAATAAQQACGSTGPALISSTLTQANAGVAKADAAIQQENAISKSLQTAASSGDLTQITVATTQYQSYLGAATTPSAADEAYASTQSTNASGTLYSQMVAAKNACTGQTQT